jgi:methionyl-tRNA formyltransferase
VKIAFIGKAHDFSLAPLNALSQFHQIVAIIESAPRQVQTGSGSFIRALLRNGYGKFKKRATMRSIAQRLGIPYLYLSRDNKDQLITFLQAIHPDIVCVASLSQLLKKEVIDVPRYGVLNLHPSLLPKYHGPFPWFWQYYECEQEWGMTVHRIDEGQDTGPIVEQELFTVETGADIYDTMAKAAPIGARLMLAAVNKIEAGTAQFTPQPPHNYPKARIVKRDEKLIYWDQWPIERVWHVMRGTYPWLDAVNYPETLRGKVKVGSYEKSDNDSPAGTVVKDERGFFVAHREGKIRLVVQAGLLSVLRRRLLLNPKISSPQC